MPTVFITGANRGIGLWFVNLYLEKGWNVIAAVRDPSTMEKKSNVTVVKLDQSNTTDSKRAVDEIKKGGVDKIDVVIINAAVHPTGAKFADINFDDLDKVYATNIRGPIVVYQAIRSLLHAGSKMVFISSNAGRIGRDHGIGEGIYGQSKAAMNYLAAKLHAEEPDLIILCFHPGWLPTDMGNTSKTFAGVEKLPDTLEDCMPAMVKVIDSATRETTQGYLVNWKGERMSL